MVEPCTALLLYANTTMVLYVEVHISATSPWYDGRKMCNRNSHSCTQQPISTTSEKLSLGNARVTRLAVSGLVEVGKTAESDLVQNQIPIIVKEWKSYMVGIEF